MRTLSQPLPVTVAFLRLLPHVAGTVMVTLTRSLDSTVSFRDSRCKHSIDAHQHQEITSQPNAPPVEIDTEFES